MRKLLVMSLLLAACTAPNPDYCPPERLEACSRAYYGWPVPPDLIGYVVVPAPDMTPDLYQCLAPLQHCSDNSEVRPGACCGNYVCFGTTCKPGLHGDCERDDDCAPVFVGKDRSPAICFMSHCMSQTGGACSADTDCASGSCNVEIARCR